MVRRVTPQQYAAELRKQQRAIEDYNRRARQHNAEVVRKVNEHNRKVDDHNRKVRAAVQAQQREIDRYNRQVTEHNRRVRANRQRLVNEVARLDRAGRATTSFVTSVGTVTTAFDQLDRAAASGTAVPDQLFDLSEGEAANSVATLNALQREPSTAEPSSEEVSELQRSAITDELTSVDHDLDNRWHGALFALNPRNPDAARHFCTSARELMTRLLEAAGPDDAVLAADPHSARTPNGSVCRRARVTYCLRRSGAFSPEIVEFVEADIENVIGLFQEFNDGTHGGAGRFDLSQLDALKRRVEAAIQFIHRIAFG